MPDDPRLSPASPDRDAALLAFFLGPVQPFIESARTLRDLWTGSYLLSWLTATAIKEVLATPGTKFITPHVDPQQNLLLKAICGQVTGDRDSTLPSLPNKFSAEVSSDKAKDLQKKCMEACDREWKKIAAAVKAALQSKLDAASPGWDRDWDAQIGSYFEFRCVTLPLAEATADKLDKLKTNSTPSLWVRQWKLLGALMDVTRSMRHVPAYQPKDDNTRYPVKCSLLGSFEQMGPANFNASKTFWEKLATPDWPGLHGTRLQTTDRLCAVSLVKRFAWPAYFAKTPDSEGRLGVHIHELRYSDTATIAAKRWLFEGELLDPDDVRRRHKKWSGQWLHWPAKTNNEDDDCPGEVWDTIQRKKSQQGKPPTYYAILHMDGDSMGEFFQGDKGKPFGEGAERHRRITERLTIFSLAVREIVEKQHGEMIYAGGDDILALLPTDTVLACARKLHATFQDSEHLGPDASLSGGSAVIHHKEDLRFALQHAHNAEKAAKRIGQGHGKPDVKDALAVTVCRRSGEHTTVVMGWLQARLLIDLVNDFAEGATDRWAYKLRSELPTLEKLLLDAGRAEVVRLLGRAEVKKAFRDGVGGLFNSYREEMRSPNRNWPDDEILAGFVTLCQSASFLARGRD